jgi:hypothetical protein
LTEIDSQDFNFFRSSRLLHAADSSFGKPPREKSFGLGEFLEPVCVLQAAAADRFLQILFVFISQCEVSCVSDESNLFEAHEEGVGVVWRALEFFVDCLEVGRGVDEEGGG